MNSATVQIKVIGRRRDDRIRVCEVECLRLVCAGLRYFPLGRDWDTVETNLPHASDSEMALALARPLVREGGFDPDAVARSYVA